MAAAGLWLCIASGSASAATGDLALQQCIEDNDVTTEADCSPDIDGLSDATGVAVSADGTSVYAVSAADDTIVNFNRNTTTGALTFSQCFDDAGNEAGCTDTTGMGGATGVAISADGTSVYVASNSDDAIVNFDRNTGTGALSGATCFEDTGTGTSCTDTAGLNGAQSVAVAPNGSSVYVAGSSDDAIVNFDRANAGGATNGDLSGAVCTEDVGLSNCTTTDAAGLDGPSGVAVAPDGTSVYVASDNDDSVVNFDRANAGGATNGDLSGATCFEDNDQGTEAACADTNGLFNANSVAVSPDGASVYAAASDGGAGDDALVNFDRAIGGGTNGDLTVAQCFDDTSNNESSCTDTAGLDGASSVVVDPEGGAGESVYVAANADDAIVNLDRSAGGATLGDLSGAVCTEDTGQNECGANEAAGLNGVAGVAASSDGKSVYTASLEDDAVDNFNREGQPAISIGDVTQAEGNSGDTAFNFTVTLNRASAQTVTVNYSTANGTATLADNDYDQVVSGTVTFAPGDTSETALVNVNGDTTDEPNEDFSVNLSSPAFASIADGTGVGTINNDDNPTISIDDVSVTEGDSGDTAANFTVSLNHASNETVTVDYATANGTATLADNDYDQANGTVTFTGNDTTETVTVNVNGDNKDEPNETFNVNLTNNSSNSSIADSQGVGTINDDDPAPSITISDPTVTEGNVGTVNANFTVSLSNPSSQTVTVDFDTSDGTATQPGDYASHSETVSFSPGDTSEQVTVQVNGDLIDESDETFNGDLSNPANATIGDPQGVATIQDDDGAPTVSVNDVSQDEGDAGTTNFDFTVSLSHPSAAPVTVDFDTSDGTATLADNDYNAHSQLVTFVPLDTSETVTVTVNGDTTDEPDEVFDVDLSNVSATATIGDGDGDGTIENDDDPEISISDPTVTEGNSGTTNANFDVTLSNESDQTVTVDFDTSDGTATDADNDYEPHSETVTFTGNDTSETVSVPVNGDTADEADEVFHGDLSNASNASILDNQGDATITNDDDPTVSIDDVTDTEGDTGEKDFDFTVSLNHASNETLTVEFDTGDGTATTTDNDYDANSGTVTFSGGSTSETVTVKVNGDTTDESDEDFTVDLSNASSGTIGDGQGEGTITNDDADPAISIGNDSDTEGDTGEKDFDFTVSLSNASDQTVTVDWATANGTATAGDNDYDANAGTVTFNPGDVSETVTVKVNGDTTDESDETFDVNLSNESSNSTIGDGTGTGTIQNDDGDPAISIGDVTDTEGNSGEKDFDFDVTLSNASDQTITVDFATANGTATTGDNDYDANSGTVTFNPGDVSETVTVKVNGDTSDESDETFDVNLTNNSSNSSVADGTGTGTITNDDGDPAISIDDVSDTEGNSGEKDFDFTVSLSNASDQTVTVDYATADDSATTTDSDYDSATGTVTFSPGDISETVTVKVNGDTTDEPDEEFDVNLTNESANSTIADGTGVGTIENDDDPAISIDNVSDTEGDTGEKDFDFTVTLDHASTEDVTVAYSTSNGTATTGDGDYDSASGTVTFTGGSTSETVTVKVNGDDKDESDETFNVDLSSPTNATIADNQGVGTITNDDADPEISIGDVTDTEGNTGEKDFDFDVTLSNPSDQTVTVQYTSVNTTGTATTTDGDFDAAAGTVTFNPNDTSETVTVKVNGDNKDESDEQFDVDLSSNSSNSSIDDGTGTATIQNDDADPEISIGDVSLDEGDSGTTAFGFAVTLSNPSSQTVTVDYDSLNGTATTGDGDYQSASATVTFAPGDTSETATVQVNGDTKNEPDEEFDVDLSNASSNSSIDDGTATGEIVNDDGQPAIEIDDVALLEGDSGDTAFAFSVDLSNPSSQTVTVDFATANGTATQPGDYDQDSDTVTFAPGDTSETVTVQVNGDTSVEADETFVVNLTNNSSNSSIADNQGLGTILDDDDPGQSPPTAPGPSGDGDPPNTTITGGPKAKTKKKQATFTFSGTDARVVASFECKVDGGSFQPCTSPLSVKVKKGTHTFQVRAVDSEGNVDPTPATQSWKVKKKKKK